MYNANRDRLVAWQRDFYTDPTGVRLHLGCGYEVYRGWHNMDAFTWNQVEGVDYGNIEDPLEYADNSVDVISCHHVLEHIPHSKIEGVLKEFVRVLKPGGLLDFAMPDIEISAQNFVNDRDWANKWSLDGSLGAIYGGQFADGMVHQGGLSLQRATEIVEALGCEIVESFHYNANGTSLAFWILCRKGKAPLVHPTILESDVVMGTFTHRTTYLPGLLDSARTFLPHVQLEIVMQNAPINVNMMELLRRFRTTNKRYWLFLDDDIQFLDDRIIENTIQCMIRNDWSLAGVYSTFLPEIIGDDYGRWLARLPKPAVRDVTFVPGYFMLADSHKIGHINPDMNLPDGNTSVDTTYCADVLAQGHNIGIADSIVYHVRKEGSWVNQAVIEPTNQYHMKRWGPFYFSVAKYCGNVIEWEEARVANQTGEQA